MGRREKREGLERTGEILIRFLEEVTIVRSKLGSWWSDGGATAAEGCVQDVVNVCGSTDNGSPSG